MAKQSDMASGLEGLPNIGREAARLLVAAGVGTPGALKRMGAVAAAVRIAGIRPDDPPCRSMLAGLEGAIRGVRWHAIPKLEREALWKVYTAQLDVPAAARGELGVSRQDAKTTKG